MKYAWLDDYLLKKPGVTKDFKQEWNWVRYQLGGKLFAAVCLGEDGKPYFITLKLEPLEGEMMRRQWPDVLPGYYMNKLHWNSIRPDGAVPDDLLRGMLDKSYDLILRSFSKKKRQELLQGRNE